MIRKLPERAQNPWPSWASGASALTGIDHESWLAMGAGERQEVIDDIEAKIQLYQDIHDNQDLWITLDDGTVKGDAVYPVPLTDLP